MAENPHCEPTPGFPRDQARGSGITRVTLLERRRAKILDDNPVNAPLDEGSSIGDRVRVALSIRAPTTTRVSWERWQMNDPDQLRVNASRSKGRRYALV